MEEEIFMTTTKTKGRKHHSAVPSWSGYNYQGKIALYCVLDFIINQDEADYSRYSLELEWYEDFSIKENDLYVSIHQVKSYKEKALPQYKDAIWNLLGKTIDSNIPLTYLHTSEDIGLTKDDIRKKLNTLKQPKEDKEDKMYTPAYYFKLVMDTGSYGKAFDSFDLYEYQTGNRYCKIAEIDDLIQEKIKEYYSSQNWEESDKQIQGVFLNLLNTLNEHITARHAREQVHGSQIEPIKINFELFHEILETNQEEPSQEYYIHHLRHSFNVSCDPFIHYLFENNIFEVEDLKRVEDLLFKINMLDNEKFLDFCKKITPDVSVPKVNMDNYKSLIPENGIKQALIKILIKVKQEVNSNYLYRRINDNKSEFYLPTTIDLINFDPDLSNYHIGKLASNILKNEDLDEFLYEVDAMVSLYISADSLEASASKIDEVPEVDSEEKPERYAKFTKIKNIRMVNLEQAEKELEE